jgi:hypothetical protein
MRFNQFETVVCVDDNNEYNAPIVIGEKYTVLYNYYGTICVNYDWAIISTKNFITLKEYRKQKLKQLKCI